jgi:hypothetical protein
MEKMETEYPELEWEVPEQYLLALCMIPNGQALLEAWQFAVSSETQVSSARTQLQTIGEACDSLAHCEPLHGVMKAMRTVANRLNSNTHRGEQAALVFESLLSFDEHKATTEVGVTALSFAVGVWKNKTISAVSSQPRSLGPKIAALRQAIQTQPVHEETAGAAELLRATLAKLQVTERGVGTLGELEQDTAKLLAAAASLRQQRKLLEERGEEGRRMAELVERGARSVEDLSQMLQTVKNKWQAVIELFGVKSETHRNTKDFFDHANKLIKQILKYI